MRARRSKSYRERQSLCAVACNIEKSWLCGCTALASAAADTADSHTFQLFPSPCCVQQPHSITGSRIVTLAPTQPDLYQSINFHEEEATATTKKLLLRFCVYNVSVSLPCYCSPRAATKWIYRLLALCPGRERRMNNRVARAHKHAKSPDANSIFECFFSRRSLLRVEKFKVEIHRALCTLGSPVCVCVCCYGASERRVARWITSSLTPSLSLSLTHNLCCSRFIRRRLMYFRNCHLSLSFFTQIAAMIFVIAAIRCTTTDRLCTNANWLAISFHYIPGWVRWTFF